MQDYANPETRKLIRVYPEIPHDGVIREVWHADKWRKNMPLDHLSPMYNAGAGQHFYVNELGRLKSGQLVIPVRWVMHKGQVHADAYMVSLQENVQDIISKKLIAMLTILQGLAMVKDSTTRLIRASDLQDNYFDLEHKNQLPRWSRKSKFWIPNTSNRLTASAIDAGYPKNMPHPKHLKANGAAIYVSFLNWFGDDVSGNKSKSWNKHLNGYFQHGNLPRKMLQQESNVHFFSTSQHASVAEQFHVFKEIVE